MEDRLEPMLPWSALIMRGLGGVAVVFAVLAMLM